MDWKQIADQLHDALRDLYENGANCPDDKVLRARDAYDAACTETDGQTHWDGCYESHYDCAIARVEELERTVEAYRRALDEAIAESPTRLRASPMPWASCAEWVNNRVAELLKEKEHGQ